MEHNLTHMIASDAHNTTSRGFHLAESYELVEKEFGTSVMSDLKENPYLLIREGNLQRRSRTNSS